MDVDQTLQSRPESSVPASSLIDTSKRSDQIKNDGSFFHTAKNQRFLHQSLVSGGTYCKLGGAAIEGYEDEPLKGYQLNETEELLYCDPIS